MEVVGDSKVASVVEAPAVRVSADNKPSVVQVGRGVVETSLGREEEVHVHG